MVYRCCRCCESSEICGRVERGRVRDRDAEIEEVIINRIKLLAHCDLRLYGNTHRRIELTEDDG